MKRILSLLCLLTAVLTLLSFSACGTSEEGSGTRDEASDTQSGLYQIENYQSDEVFDIEEVSLSSDNAQRCKTYTFRFLSDGYRIRGYLSLPTSAVSSNEPCKCILFCRGGNANMGPMNDSYTSYICSVTGRAVIAAELRGAGDSEGADQFGGDDLHDVIKLVDLCEKHFSFVDMADFCVVGTSRGGMSAYMAARLDKRIRRIIAISAVSDLFRSYEERDDMKEVMESLIGCTPEENPAEYEKRSAICWTDEITVPVMIFHSTNDERVSYAQAQEMYEKLKDNIDCTLITHDDDRHGDILPEDYKTINEWLAP